MMKTKDTPPFIFYCSDKYYGQKAVVEERIYLSLHLVVYIPRNSGWELKIGIWRPELMQRPWKYAAYWLASHSLLSLIS